MKKPPELIANRVINTEIRENRLSGWDTGEMLTVEEVHALIVKALEIDRS